mmetsp:Transcript_11753/g.42936  ORF Transcript_11753/g.42936 Transcript_11753/m.42936 type:complete len:189 (+) Transcript_11753:84-650(+)
MQACTLAPSIRSSAVLPRRNTVSVKNVRRVTYSRGSITVRCQQVDESVDTAAETPASEPAQEAPRPQRTGFTAADVDGKANIFALEPQAYVEGSRGSAEPGSAGLAVFWGVALGLAVVGAVSVKVLGVGSEEEAPVLPEGASLATYVESFTGGQLTVASYLSPPPPASAPAPAAEETDAVVPAAPEVF